MKQRPFVPHSYQHLLDVGVFAPPLPEKFYEGLLADYDVLDVDTFDITYDSDGLAVTGLFCVPKNINPAGHPVVIYNRGGNREFGKLTLLSVMRSMAPFARKGYLVFASNYRGNGGSEGQDKFGGSDVNDVLNLLTLAKKHPGFDSKNAFMIGHSRGGMMTYLAMKNGAKLNAAVSIAGGSDLFLSAQLRPAMEKNVFSQLIHGNREEEYKKRSATYWPEALTTPLLLLHGDADDKVDMSHSLRLAEVLTCPHELEIYPGGNHALVRQWDAVVERILQWMERYRT